MNQDKIIGSGGQSKVKLVRHRVTQQLFALKQIELKHYNPKVITNLKREIETHSLLNHPNIIKFVDY